MVKLLLKHPLVKPDIKHNYPLRIAATNGYVDLVQLLMEDARVDPSDLEQDACTILLLLTCPIVKTAAKNGHHGVVSVLLKDKRVDPAVSSNYGI